MIWFRSEVWLPRLDDLARSMSVNWADSGKRARFVALLAERQAQKDADPFYTHWSFHETFASGEIDIPLSQ